MTDVAIIANGGANIASLRFALDRLGVSSRLTADSDELRRAPRVILPGVGAAADAMERLHALGLLFAGSEEGDTTCLGILPAQVTRFPDRRGFPVPHMGWNQVVSRTDSPLTRGLGDDAYVYFVHSYAAPVGPWTEAVTDYGGDFSAIVRHANFHGAQFHPERSSRAGQRLLANFLALA
jgi:glutamine amidotransferase